MENIELTREDLRKTLDFILQGDLTHKEIRAFIYAVLNKLENNTLNNDYGYLFKLAIAYYLTKKSRLIILTQIFEKIENDLIRDDLIREANAGYLDGIGF